MSPHKYAEAAEDDCVSRVLLTRPPAWPWPEHRETSIAARHGISPAEEGHST
jgi:hypothetical protein